MEHLKAWLKDRGTEDIDHPGGTLYAHLLRVHDRLRALGQSEHVQLAGLLHAVYGTDGFQLALADWTDRTPVRELVGAQAEALVYRYGACDRQATWDRLAETREVTDRFTGRTERLGEDDVRSLIDLSIVNELDVYEQSAEIAARHGESFRTLFAAWAPMASPSVNAEVKRVLG